MTTPPVLLCHKVPDGYWNRPGRYNECPKCGGLKCKTSKLCESCILRSPKGRPVLQQPDDPSYRFIPLTKGQRAIIDVEFYDLFMQWKWSALWNKGIKSFYAVRYTKKNGSFYMHREILGLKKGDKRDGEHANHNTLDNRRFINGKEQLRAATRQENSWNQGIRISNKTGYKWVYEHKGKYRYSLRINGKRIQVSGFSTPKDAYDAACVAAAEHHKQFARIA